MIRALELIKELDVLTPEVLGDLLGEHCRPEEVQQYAKLFSEVSGVIRTLLSTEITLRKEDQQKQVNYDSLYRIYLAQLGRERKLEAQVAMLQDKANKQRKELRRLNKQVQLMVTMRAEARSRVAASYPSMVDSGFFSGALAKRSQQLHDGDPRRDP